MNAVGGTIHVRRRASGCPLRAPYLTLCSSPGFSAIAILSLALGIGANTAIFSLINAIILKTLPVSHPEQLVQLVMKTENGTTFTNPWEQVRDRQDVFSGAFAYSPIQLNLAGGGEVRNASASWVSGDFFSTLGVQPLLGRTFTAADDKRGCPAIAVLSHDFWQREYGGRGRCLRAAVDAQQPSGPNRRRRSARIQRHPSWRSR
jgi:putative ABC transport system permease protein